MLAQHSNIAYYTIVQRSYYTSSANKMMSRAEKIIGKREDREGKRRKDLRGGIG